MEERDRVETSLIASALALGLGLNYSGPKASPVLKASQVWRAGPEQTLASLQ